MKKYHAENRMFSILCTDGVIRRLESKSYLLAKISLKNSGFKPIQLIDSKSYY